MEPPAPESGVGCRSLAIATAVLLGVASAEVALGLWLALSTPPIAEPLGFALYGAGAPVSAGFAAAFGELPLAPFTDVIVWLVVAVGVARVSERLQRPLLHILGVVLGLAVVYGALVSLLIERV